MPSSGSSRGAFLGSALAAAGLAASFVGACTQRSGSPTGAAAQAIDLAPIGGQHPGADPKFSLFESGQVRPLALSPNGKRLYAVNTPAGRLEIIEAGERSYVITGALIAFISIVPSARSFFISIASSSRPGFPT
jgi:hypothetical protein